MRADVLIVGAGPAGFAAAKTLQANGVRTLVIDRATPPRIDRIETLTESAVTSLLALGFPAAALTELLIEVRHAATAWGNRPSSALLGGTEFTALWALRRSSLASGLRETLKTTGVTVLAARAMTMVADGAATSVLLDSGETLTVPIAVDATGRGSRFLRQFGARLRNVDRMTAVSIPMRRTDPPGTFHVESTEHGWLTYIVDQSTVGLATFYYDNDLVRANPKSVDLLRAALRNSPRLEHLADEADRNSLVYSPAATAYLDRAIHGTAWAVGDAAQTLDPLSGNGIAAALASGIRVADAISVDLAGAPADRGDPDALRRADMQRHLATRVALYAAAGQQGEFWARRSPS